MKATQNKALDLEIDLNQAMGKLETLLKESKDQDATLAQADRVMSVESKLKRTRLALALKVKGLLTSDQLTTLKELKKKRRQKRRERRQGRRKD